MARYNVHVPENRELKLWTPGPAGLRERCLKGGKIYRFQDGTAPSGHAHWLVLVDEAPVVGAMRSHIENQGAMVRRLVPRKSTKK